MRVADRHLSAVERQVCDGVVVALLFGLGVRGGVVGTRRRHHDERGEHDQEQAEGAEAPSFRSAVPSAAPFGPM